MSALQFVGQRGELVASFETQAALGAARFIGIDTDGARPADALARCVAAVRAGNTALVGRMPPMNTEARE